SDAERVLRGWLDGPRERAEASALALARLANRTKHLDDATLVSLLDAASSEHPLDGALVPFTRLGPAPGAIAERLLQVATDSIAAGGLRRTFAVRALGRAGPAAAEPLGKLVADAGLPAPLRADA